MKLASRCELKEKKDAPYISKEIANMLIELKTKIEKKGLTIVSGKGHHMEPIVKDYNTLTKLLLKTLEYEEKEAICGPNRNSYYKTDKDATAMCLKEDYYSGMGSNMHAAYSLQILVSKGIILDYYVSQDRSDSNTLIPFLKIFHNDYGCFPKRLCADSGYGSYTNYEFLEENNIENYVKHTMWQKMMEGSYISLYHFDDGGNFTCINNNKGEIVERSSHSRGRGNAFYKVSGCNICEFKEYCFRAVKDKDVDERVFEASFQLYKYKETATTNLLSPKGIEMRINRSSQVEGAFGNIKQNMGYDRTRRRSLQKVEYEISLVCLGHVIRKFFTILEGKSKLEYWKAPEDLPAEIPKKYSLKKLCKKRTKGINETIRSQGSKKGVRKS